MLKYIFTLLLLFSLTSLRASADVDIDNVIIPNQYINEYETYRFVECTALESLKLFLSMIPMKVILDGIESNTRMRSINFENQYISDTDQKQRRKANNRIRKRSLSGLGKVTKIILAYYVYKSGTCVGKHLVNPYLSNQTKTKIGGTVEQLKLNLLDKKDQFNDTVYQMLDELKANKKFQNYKKLSQHYYKKVSHQVTNQLESLKVIAK